MEKALQACVPCLAPPANKSKAAGTKKYKRAAVSAEAISDKDEPTEIQTYEKSAAVKEKLLQQTASQTLFAGLSDEQRNSVIDAMFEVTTRPAQVIIQQGDMGE